MKESIENKLEEHGKKILGKEELSMDDVNFLVYLLNRIECKEAQRISKENEEAKHSRKQTTRHGESICTVCSKIWEVLKHD